MGLIPSQGTKIQHSEQCVQKKNTKNVKGKDLDPEKIKGECFASGASSPSEIVYYVVRRHL